METEDYSLSIFAFCNMGIVYGMLAFVFYMFSFIVSSKENIDFLHQQCLIDYISEGLFYLIAGATKQLINGELNINQQNLNVQIVYIKKFVLLLMMKMI